MSYGISLDPTGKQSGSNIFGQPGGLPNFLWTILWIDASQNLNSNLGAPVITSGALSNIPDISALSTNNAFQTNGSLRPTYVSNILNGQPVFRFSGTQYLVSGLNLTIAGAFPNVTGFAVFRHNTASGNSKLIGSDGGFGRMFGFDNRAAGFNFCYGNGTGVSGIATLSANTWYLISWEWNAGNNSVSFWINKIFQVSGSGISPNGATTTGIGALHPGTEPWNGDIAEIILYNRIMSAIDRQATENYLTSKWNI